MQRKFPLYFDITDRKIVIYGAGRIATRRVETLLDFAPSLLVVAPDASQQIREAAAAKELIYQTACYEKGAVPDDAFAVLAATDDQAFNDE
ncbi:MAG: bifunctional precorrin-2 dehydrogenase/sirohydrochlorin ferrochelatase, partial [Lachnospiraceae bacterium]|nr:bifunctional precorrin-2 dehydrogenase/sirohydrochlorin ferrochelatase [Lachnospiraceae bacterium]